ncbi:hypothetical protein GTV32_22975 [Gordonia sp. SID5947]|uniref:hypothetical protein n=1 Tax=Gordonia sp. SID5947 TaxID=2690315 RepID=UPI00136ACC6F|nr:hypothetical protein [Gordonia sp. SID5947]MYR08997.1 hypothetical protein [Gordonia sp. SID5947]
MIEPLFEPEPIVIIDSDITCDPSKIKQVIEVVRVISHGLSAEVIIKNKNEIAHLLGAAGNFSLANNPGAS